MHPWSIWFFANINNYFHSSSCCFHSVSFQSGSSRVSFIDLLCQWFSCWCTGNLMQLLSHVKLSTAFVQSITSQRALPRNSLKYANNRLNMAAAYLLSFMLTLDVYVQRSLNDGAKTLRDASEDTHSFPSCCQDLHICVSQGLGN